jgi:hypothetical protein
MKKRHVLSFLIAGFSLTATAQQSMLPPVQPSRVEVKTAPSPGTPNWPAKVNSTESNWYFPYNTSIFSAPDQNTFKTYANFLFPDSLPKVVFSTGTSHWATHAVGAVLDPKDEIYPFVTPPSNPLSKFNPYTIDSVYFQYFYVRMLDTVGGNAVVDTLFIQYFKGTGSSTGISKGTITGGELTARVNGITTTSTPGPILSTLAMRTDTVLLTKTDSTGVTFGTNTTFRFKEMQFHVGLSVPVVAGENLSAFTLTFKPGYSYAMGDTMIVLTGGAQPSKKMNFFGYRELINEDDSSRQVKQFKYVGNSLVMPKFSRYPDASTGAWQGFVPGNAYFQDQYMIGGFHITSNNVGVKNINGSGYGLGNAYPNPANGRSTVTIPFAIGKAGEVKLTVTSIIGQTMIATSGQFGSGENNFTLDLNKLKPGVYFYTVSSGNYTATKKFTVTE